MKHGPPCAFLLGLLASCAQVRDPQGGPKDTAAPVLLAAEPPDGSTHFTAGRIVLHFDERITLDRVREKLLVSPPLAKAPDVQVSGGRDVVIALNAPLAANTTYTFNVGDAVADLSEGNHAAGLTYVLSTGDHVDSLSLHGQVQDAFTGQATAGVLVLLHDAADTTTVRTGMPAYFTRTDANGVFHVEHLRAGLFRLTALRDQNADYRYDLPNEDIAFVGTDVAAGDTTVWSLDLFREPAIRQQLVEARVRPDRGWRLVLARPATELSLRSLDREGDPLTWSPEWNATRDTVLLWPSDTALLVGQRFELRERTEVLDTITYRPTARMPFYVSLSLRKDTLPNTYRLEAARPLIAVDTAHIRVAEGSVERPVTVLLDTAAPRVLRIMEHPPVDAGKRELLLLPGAVKDHYRASNDTLRFPIGGSSDQGSGELQVTVKADSTQALSGPAVLQLIDAGGHAARELQSAQWPLKVVWRNVAPGAYTLRLIDDRNADGRWTTGSYTTGTQPERTFRYTTPVTVRADWTIEVVWPLGH